MMDLASTAAQLGVGGIFAVLVIRSVLEHIRAKKNGHADRKIDEMHEWLSQRGPRGEKLIYGPPGLDEDVKRLGDRIDANTDALHEQTRVMERMLGKQDEGCAETRALTAKIQELLGIYRR